MPVEFLTDAQVRAYARFDGDPGDIVLARHFYLDAADWQLLAGRRGDHNRLGLAVQLCTVRYLGTFLPDLREIPERVVTYIARPLNVSDPGPHLDRYHTSHMRRDHVAALKKTYGYRDFTDPQATFPLVRLLSAALSPRVDERGSAQRALRPGGRVAPAEQGAPARRYHARPLRGPSARARRHAGMARAEPSAHGSRRWRSCGRSIVWR